MLTASQRIHVDVPVAEVFVFIDDPHNQPVISPSVTQIRNVEPLPDGGKRLEYTYRIAGIPFSGTLETTTYEPEERVVFDMDGGISGRIEWVFEASETGTWFEYRAEYTFPIPDLIERLFAPLFDWYNDRELRRTAVNLKTRLEE